MLRRDYHELATVHHDAKADVYGAAGFGAKAAGHRHRARWHASFGSPKLLLSYDEMIRKYSDWSLTVQSAPGGNQDGSYFPTGRRDVDRRKYDELVRLGAVLDHATPKLPSYDEMIRRYSDWSLTVQSLPGGNHAGSYFPTGRPELDRREYEKLVRLGAVLDHATPKFGGRLSGH